jgi:hypothetical protein
MADRLKAEGRPLVLAPRSGPYPGRLDANLLDLCLEHGVPVADPPPAAVIDLAAWLRSDAGGGVRRDLESVAADRRFGPLLDAAVPAFCANARRPAEELLVSPALQPLVQGWLERTVKGQPHHHGEAATAGRARRWFDRAATGHDSLVALAGSLEALAPGGRAAHVQQVPGCPDRAWEHRRRRSAGGHTARRAAGRAWLARA